MTLVRLADARVLVHNAIALDDSAMGDIEAWGEPAAHIVPNGFHRLDAFAWKQRYPKSLVLCPREAERKVRAVVAVDGHYDSLPTDGSVTVERVEGTCDLVPEGVFTVRTPDGRVGLIFNDMLFNHRDVPGAQGWVMKHITRSTGHPRVTNVMRVFGVASAPRVAAHLRRLADTPGLSWAIPGHGEVVTGDVGTALRRVADELYPG